MPKSDDFNRYLDDLGRALRRGDATEHTHRPALKSLVESLEPRLSATNEPKRTACGAPDVIVSRGPVPIGYIETKDVGIPLDKEEKGEQLKRYFDGLENLILTDYLEFRWYVAGERRLTARLASETGGRLRPEKDGAESVGELLTHFLSHVGVSVSTPRDLASRMAGLARLIRGTIANVLAHEAKSGSLHEQMEAFRKVLLHDLDSKKFADMYAQTISYGLFAARCNVRHAPSFNREHAAYDLPKTNPFLRRMFTHIAGPELDERVSWAVDDLAELLRRANMVDILKDFGQRTRREDPILHFYETFLSHYDPKMREARGVYYTPEPVVSYIARSVDTILKRDFGLKDGLADSTRIKMPSGKGESEVHKVLILDPAAGTGTFLHSVVDLIRESFRGNKGLWSGYVSEHLLPRVFGFELLMAPYAIAHMKLGFQLAESGYDFGSDERLQIYLTNTLEEAFALSKTEGFNKWIAEEANAASKVKRDYPVMVVLGNPPYSGHSENKGAWIHSLIDEYKKGYPDLQKPGQAKWLSDDYVKFIRFAQWRIEQTGYGVLAFVTNNGYLENPTFKGMRRSLLNSFDDLYILDLHGSTKKKETSPDGSPDKNVFDIQQGVAIAVLVRRRKQDLATRTFPTIHHADLWGAREEHDLAGAIIGGKYFWLAANDVTSTRWNEFEPTTPDYVFVPPRSTRGPEYRRGVALPSLFPLNGDPAPGIVTTHDEFAISWDDRESKAKVRQLLATKSEADARALFQLCTQSQWNYGRAKRELESGDWENEIVPILYRPFDLRSTIFNRNVAVHRRERVMHHMLTRRNIGLSTVRSTEIARGWEHILCARDLIQHHTVSLKEVNYLFPLYLYPDEGQRTVSRADQAEALRLAVRARGANASIRNDEAAAVAAIERLYPAKTYPRFPNLDPVVLERLATGLRLEWLPDGRGDLKRTFGPEDVFDYVYAILHSPTYRKRYAEFLRAEWPRVPFTSQTALFRRLCDFGNGLVALHVMGKAGPKLPSFPVAGSNEVERIRYSEPGQGAKNGRVWINASQFFEDISPQIWDFHIGGYQVAEKWLKDRRGRKLSFDELEHYRKVISILSETGRLMPEIDAAIEANGGWPIQ